MKFVTTRGEAPPTSLEWALFDGLAPDGSLYVPESIDRWTAQELAALPSYSLAETGVRVLRPYTSDQIDEATLGSIVGEALNFPIPLKEIEPGVHVLELFHGPTLAFKDIGARVMARLISALHDRSAPTSVLVATSGDTGSAVAHAFYRVPHTRVLVLYPNGRVSPQQQAQMAMFNAEPDTNVRAYAVAGNFDDCQRLVKAASADPDVLGRIRVTSANSINIGRLLPQMVYYFHAIGQLGSPTRFPEGVVVSTPSGNFGNLTAGLMAKRAGLPIARFIAATNVNDVVPVYLATGRFEPRPSQQTLANAMDVGHPSNFDRMLWMYGGLDAMRADIVGSRHTDDQVKATIRRVYDAHGYLLDPHSAIGYLGLTTTGVDLQKTPGVFLATAHPAKFHEVVEAIIGQEIEKPAALADALARPQHVIHIEASLDAVKELLFA